MRRPQPPRIPMAGRLALAPTPVGPVWRSRSVFLLASRIGMSGSRVNTITRQGTNGRMSRITLEPCVELGGVGPLAVHVPVATDGPKATGSAFEARGNRGDSVRLARMQPQREAVATSTTGYLPSE